MRTSIPCRGNRVGAMDESCCHRCGENMQCYRGICRLHVRKPNDAKGCRRQCMRLQSRMPRGKIQGRIPIIAKYFIKGIILIKYKFLRTLLCYVGSNINQSMASRWILASIDREVQDRLQIDDHRCTRIQQIYS